MEMPDWIKNYSEFISYEEDRREALFNGKTTIHENAPLALIELQVQVEIEMLIRLEKAKIIPKERE